MNNYSKVIIIFKACEYLFIKSGLTSLNTCMKIFHFSYELGYFDSYNEKIYKSS